MSDREPRREARGPTPEYPIGPRLVGQLALYRVIAEATAKAADFESNYQRGRDPVGPERGFLGSETDIHRAVSMFDGAEQALELARRQRRAHVAKLVISSEAASTTVAVRRTGQRAGHHSVWAEPGTLLSLVSEVIEVSGL